jgi:hypothetical protein
MGYKALRTDRYKYIRYTELVGVDELYDLAQDTSFTIWPRTPRKYTTCWQTGHLSRQ